VDEATANDPSVTEPAPEGRGGRRTTTVAAIAVPAMVVLAVFVSRSSIFAVGRVTVTGESHLSAAKVIKESGVRGRNVLWLDEGAVERALERDPWISRAVVSRSLPPSVTIAIVERVPVAVIQGSADFTVIASDATVLGTRRIAGRLPVILPGTIPAGARETYDGPTRALAALSATVRGQVASVSQDARGDLAMRLRSGTLVRFGPATDVQAKADALSAVLAYAAGRRTRVASIDVRFPAAPSAQLGDGTSITPSN
jgi:cell division protein FtsQ